MGKVMRQQKATFGRFDLYFFFCYGCALNNEQTLGALKVKKFLMGFLWFLLFWGCGREPLFSAWQNSCRVTKECSSKKFIIFLGGQEGENKRALLGCRFNPLKNKLKDFGYQVYQYKVTKASEVLTILLEDFEPETVDYVLLAGHGFKGKKIALGVRYDEPDNFFQEECFFDQGGRSELSEIVSLKKKAKFILQSCMVGRHVSDGLNIAQAISEHFQRSVIAPNFLITEVPYFESRTRSGTFVWYFISCGLPCLAYEYGFPTEAGFESLNPSVHSDFKDPAHPELFALYKEILERSSQGQHQSSKDATLDLLSQLDPTEPSHIKYFGFCFETLGNLYPLDSMIKEDHRLQKEVVDSAVFHVQKKTGAFRSALYFLAHMVHKNPTLAFKLKKLLIKVDGFLDDKGLVVKERPLHFLVNFLGAIESKKQFQNLLKKDSCEDYINSMIYKMAHILSLKDEGDTAYVFACYYNLITLCWDQGLFSLNPFVKEQGYYKTILDVLRCLDIRDENFYIKKEIFLEEVRQQACQLTQKRFLFTYFVPLVALGFFKCCFF